MSEQAPRLGYYLFLGLGDFPRRSQYAPDGPTLEWTCRWSLDEWKRRLNRLRDLDCNILFVYLMGFSLPYRSARYPECIEDKHPNVDDDFFQKVIEFANDLGIDVVAVFTTTGHARTFSIRHPQLAICDRNGEIQPKRGIICHHRADARRYATGVIEELLSRYTGFAGASLHPPEFVSSPCFCEACCEVYRRSTGDDLRQATDDQAKHFFMQTNLEFQNQWLEPLINERLPDAQRFVFTVPPIFGQQFDSFAHSIPRDHIIVEWCYELAPDAIDALVDRLNRFRAFGHQVWFMPTSGYFFIEGQNRSRSQEENVAAVIEQIRRVRAAHVGGVVYFTGPCWWSALEATHTAVEWT